MNNKPYKLLVSYLIVCLLAPAWSVLASASDSGIAPQYTYSVSPVIAYLRGSGWTQDILTAEFAKVQNIYDQCGIKVTPSRMIEVEPIDGRLDLQGQYDLELTKALNEPARPLMFFVRSAGVFYSHLDEFTPDSPMRSMVNTSWIGAEMLTQKYRSYRDPKYSPIAHELAHILCGCGHVDPGQRNLLAGDVDSVNDQLTPEQCATFKKSPLVRPLH